MFIYHLDTRPRLCSNAGMTPLQTFAYVTGYMTFIIGALLVYWLPTPNSNEWPAWVQATGSIAAILTLIGVTLWQIQNAQEIKRKDVKEARASIAALARVHANEVANIGRYLCAGYEEMFSDRTLVTTQAAIDSLDPNALRSGQAVLLLHKLRLEVESAFKYRDYVEEEEVNGVLIFDQDEGPVDPRDLIRCWKERVESLVSELEAIAEST